MLFGPVNRRLAGPQVSVDSPVSSPHPVAGSLGLQMCSTASCSTWLLGIQTQVLTFASSLTEASPQPTRKLLSIQYVIRWMLSAHCVQTVMPGLGNKSVLTGLDPRRPLCGEKPQALQKLEPWLCVTNSFLPSSNKPQAVSASLSCFSHL